MHPIDGRWSEEAYALRDSYVVIRDAMIPIAEAMSCLVRRVTELEEEIAALREGRPAPKRAKDGDCMPSARDEIAAILGLNGSAGVGQPPTP